MTDWIEHNGGPQPVGDDVWVEAQWPFAGGRFSGEPDEMEQASELPWEGNKLRYRILNQHLIDAKQAEIDAARLEGIRLGLDAAVVLYADKCRVSGRFKVAMSFVTHAEDILALNPETIAKEAQRD